MTMTDGDEQGGRTTEFQGGISGGGAGVTAATALPQVQQADPTFQGGSSLMIPNTVRPVNGVSDRSYLQSMMPAISKNSPFTRAQADEQQEQQELSAPVKGTAV
jgi:hypothetical protein